MASVKRGQDRQTRWKLVVGRAIVSKTTRNSIGGSLAAHVGARVIRLVPQELRDDIEPILDRFSLEVTTGNVFIVLPSRYAGAVSLIDIAFWDNEGICSQI